MTRSNGSELTPHDEASWHIRGRDTGGALDEGGATEPRGPPASASGSVRGSVSLPHPTTPDRIAAMITLRRIGAEALR